MEGRVDMKREEAMGLFERMHPGFFEKPYIKAIAKGNVYEEMTLALADFSGDALTIAVPQGITFGMYEADDLTALQESVALVDGGWVQYFDKKDNVFCAFDGDKVVSFCLLDDMGTHELCAKATRIAGRAAWVPFRLTESWALAFAWCSWPRRSSRNAATRSAIFTIPAWARGTQSSAMKRCSTGTEMAWLSVECWTKRRKRQSCIM